MANVTLAHPLTPNPNLDPSVDRIKKLKDRAAQVKTEYINCKIEHAALENKDILNQKKYRFLAKSSIARSDFFIAVKDYLNLQAKICNYSICYWTELNLRQSNESDKSNLEKLFIKLREFHESLPKIRDQLCDLSLSNSNSKSKFEIFFHQLMEQNNEAKQKIKEALQKCTQVISQVAENKKKECSLTEQAKKLIGKKRLLEEKIQALKQTNTLLEEKIAELKKTAPVPQGSLNKLELIHKENYKIYEKITFNSLFEFMEKTSTCLNLTSKLRNQLLADQLDPTAARKEFLEVMIMDYEKICNKFVATFLVLSKNENQVNFKLKLIELMIKKIEDVADILDQMTADVYGSSDPRVVYDYPAQRAGLHFIYNRPRMIKSDDNYTLKYESSKSPKQFLSENK